MTMNETAQSIQEVFGRLKPYDSAAVGYRYARAIEGLHDKIVVLDDDPTGVQTVHDVFVYTDWSVEALRQAFADERPMFFVLTNSRGLTAEQSARLHREIGENLAAVSRETGRDFQLVSRSDSTLRGHYPLETEVLRRTLEAALPVSFDGEILMPFFPEGGRYTAWNIHYVAEDGALRPVGTTEFAKDKTFGFRASSLPDWVEEKTQGACRRENVLCIGLELLRRMAYDEIAARLCEVRGFGKVVVNAVDYNDVKVFVTALTLALAQGKRFLYRTAAAFPKVLGGVGSRLLLSGRELVSGEAGRGGLVVVGSHVSKTSRQLQRLLERPDLCALEFNQHLVLDPPALEREVQRVVSAAEAAILEGTTAVVYTRRERLDVGSGGEAELNLAVRISDAVTSIVRRLSVRPAWLIAKGGITSSEIGVKGLGVRRARVLGQALAGVPVWETGPESRFPGLAYVIFPGNVGGPDALYELVGELCVVMDALVGRSEAGRRDMI